MLLFWRPALLCLTVYFSSLNSHSLAQNIIADTYLQVFWATGTTTFSTGGYFLLWPSTRTVTNPTTIYAPCGTEWRTTRKIMTVIDDNDGQTQIRDEPSLTSGLPTSIPPMPGGPMIRPTNSDMETTCRAVFTQLVKAYGTTAIFEYGDAIPLAIKINPTNISSPIGPEWTTIRRINTRYSRVKYLRTQTRDEPILTLIGDSPVEFTLTTPRWWVSPLRCATTPMGHLLEAYGTTTRFRVADTRSQSPIIEINPTPMYGPIGPQWTTTREIITVLDTEYFQIHDIDDPILTSMNVRPTGSILPSPPACTPPASRPQEHMTSSMPLETALSTSTPPAQDPMADTAPTPVIPPPSLLTPAPDLTTTPMWLLRTEL